MNLLLIESHETTPDGRLRLTDRRADHLRKVLAVEVGTEVRAGVVDGELGSAHVEAVDSEGVSLRFRAEEGANEEPGRRSATDQDAASGAAPDLNLILALPRPPVMGRLFETAATFGLQRIDLVNSWRVEKSFFSSRVLEPEAIRRRLLLGAEQGMKTRLPKVETHPRLLPFLDRLDQPADPDDPAPEIRLLAHPGAATSIDQAMEAIVETEAEVEAGIAPPSRPSRSSCPIRLAIGPEGGWIDREVASFEERGFVPVDLGPWVLRVETAVSVALGQIALVLRQIGCAGES